MNRLLVTFCLRECVQNQQSVIQSELPIRKAKNECLAGKCETFISVKSSLDSV